MEELITFLPLPLRSSVRVGKKAEELGATAIRASGTVGDRD
jgi:hypothetical protein